MPASAVRLTPRAMRPWAAALALLLSATALAAPASGQAVGAAAPPVASAAALYDKGMIAVKKEDWQKAYEAFGAAWKVKRHYQIAAQLGRAALKLGKHRDAAERLSFLLREAKDLSEDDRALAHKMLREATAKIATLTILVNREGATLLIDGEVAGASPMPRAVYVEPGKRTIEARLPGERAQKVSVELGVGSVRQVALRFPEAPRVTRKTAEGDGGSPGPNKVLLGTGIGIGGVAMGIGALTAALSFARAGKRDRFCGQPGDPGYPGCKQEQWDDIELSRTRLSNIARATLVGGGVTLGLTAAYAWLGPRSPEGPRQTMRIRILPTASGVLITGNW